MANVNIILPPTPAAGSSSNTITLWSAAISAQQTYQTSATAYANGVLADQMAAANPTPTPS